MGCSQENWYTHCLEFLMTALTSGSILSSFVCTLDRELCPGESPNSFPLHSPGLRSCFSHLMLLCSGRGRAGEESGSIAVRHAIKCNSEVTESDVSQCLLWQRKGGRAGLLFEGTENSSGNLGECVEPALGLEGTRSAGQHVQPFLEPVQLANGDSSFRRQLRSG